MPAKNLKDAIFEALDSLGGCGTIPEATSYILRQYGNKWTDIGTAMADLCVESESSCYPSQERVLTRVGRGKYCLSSKISSGRQATVNNASLEVINKKLISCAKEFKIKEDYSLGYTIVRQVFDNYPDNTVKFNVLLKFAVLNTLYNTVIFDKSKMTEHIHKLAVQNELDTMLQKGDLEAINLIRRGHGIKRKNATAESDLYSFATKYCIFSNCKKYPMYDSRVHKAIENLQELRYLPVEGEQNLKNPHELKKIVDLVINRIGFSDYMQADHALWVYGDNL